MLSGFSGASSVVSGSGVASGSAGGVIGFAEGSSVGVVGSVVSSIIACSPPWFNC